MKLMGSEVKKDPNVFNLAKFTKGERDIKTSKAVYTCYFSVGQDGGRG